MTKSDTDLADAIDPRNKGYGLVPMLPGKYMTAVEQPILMMPSVLIAASDRLRQFAFVRRMSSVIFEGAIAAITVDNLAISMRLTTILRRENITTLGQVIGRTKAEWLLMENCGAVTVEEISQLVSQLGFEMGEQL